MKRKYADRPGWSRILDKTYSNIFIDEQDFYGHVAYLALNKVKEQLWVTYDQSQLCIVDDGYVWLQHFPIGGEVMLTSTFDNHGQLLQCYFDIVKKVGTTIEGIPYCDDLYIDVVALPNGEIHILDEDELDDAYTTHEITSEEYEFAKSAASDLVFSLKKGSNYLMNSTERYYRFMRNMK